MRALLCQLRTLPNRMPLPEAISVKLAQSRIVSQNKYFYYKVMLPRSFHYSNRKLTPKTHTETKFGVPAVY